MNKMTQYKKYLLVPLAILIGILLGLSIYETYMSHDPVEDVTKGIESMIAGDSETAECYMNYHDVAAIIPSEAYRQILTDNLSCEILSVSRKGNEGTAKIVVRNVEKGAAYPAFVAAAAQKVFDVKASGKGQEDLSKTLDQLEIEALTEAMDPVELEMSLPIKRYGKTWCFELTEDQIDGMLGGFVTARAQALAAVAQVEKGSLDMLKEVYGLDLDDGLQILMSAGQYLIKDVWDGVLCDVVSCINAGTDAKGETYDLEKGMTKLTKVLEDKAKYDKMVDGVSQKAYKSEKKAWKTLSGALADLVSDIKDHDPEPEDYSYQPDTAAFTEAMDAYVSAVFGH